MTSASSMVQARLRAGTPRTIAEQPVLGPWVRAQAVNLSRHLLALRPFTREDFGSGPEMPSEGHLLAVNQLLERLRQPLAQGDRRLRQLALAAIRRPTAEMLTAVVTAKHRAHHRVLAVEKVWDFYFELFGQRQSPYGSWLLSCDRIALDCYQDAYVGIGIAKTVPAPPPFSYMRTGFGPATYRRAIPLSKLGKLANPFPLVHLPYHRLVNPWTLGAILHEVSHNLQSDLGLNRAIPRAVGMILLQAGLPREVVATWVRWNREAFADVSGLLLGGPCVVASLMDVVGRAPQVVYYFDPNGVHPTPYLRVLLSCLLLERMGFSEEAARFRIAWQSLYPNPTSGTFPPALLNSAAKAMPLVIEAMAYRKHPELGGKALSDLFRFAPKEQRMVEECAGRLARGTDPGIVPERFLIGAARVAFDQRLANPEHIREHFYQELGRR